MDKTLTIEDLETEFAELQNEALKARADFRDTARRCQSFWELSSPEQAARERKDALAYHEHMTHVEKQRAKIKRALAHRRLHAIPQAA